MAIGLLGRKIGTTQIYDEEGTLVPVTVVEAGPCVVLQCKTSDRDGYTAVQLGYLDKPRRLASRSERGHVTDLAGSGQAAKAGCEPKRFIREFRLDGEIPVTVGDELTVSSLDDVAKVDVISRSKGRGTAGVMKRHNFRGQRASHGVKRVHRHPGSIGQSADPARVIKGTKMAGRHGAARVTVRNLKIVARDPELNLIMLKGSVPGPRGGFVTIRPAGD
jgi:large subunit ribosomal protein L3